MKHLGTNNNTDLGTTTHVRHNYVISLVQNLVIKMSKLTDLISMDFAKAFDTIPHCRLLYKLQWYGIQGNPQVDCKYFSKSFAEGCIEWHSIFLCPLECLRGRSLGHYCFSFISMTYPIV